MKEERKRENEIGANRRKGKKQKERRRSKQGRRRKKLDREGRGRKRRGKKREIFPEFRISDLDGSRRKVDPRIASYTWVPKSWSFVKLHEVGNFPTWNIFSLKSMK